MTTQPKHWTLHTPQEVKRKIEANPALARRIIRLQPLAAKALLLMDRGDKTLRVPKAFPPFHLATRKKRHE